MKFRRFFSIILSTAMLASLLPTVVGAATVSTGPAPNINDGLLVYLNMDDNTDDQTGSTSPTLKGTATYEAGVNGGKAIRFDGASGTSNANRLQFENREELKFGSAGVYSFSFWMKSTSAPDNGFVIGSKQWHAEKNYGWGLSASANQLRFNPSAASDNGVETLHTFPTGQYYTGDWVNVTTTKTAGGVIGMYVNGQKVSTTTQPNTDSSGRDGWKDMCIGADYNGKYGVGNSMALDEIKVWNRPLAEDEVKYLYADTLGETVTDLNIGGPSGTVSIGTKDLSIPLTATVDTASMKGFAPYYGISWDLKSDPTYVSVTPGETGKATLDIKKEIPEGSAITIDVKVGSVSTTYQLTATKTVTPTQAVIDGSLDITQSAAGDVTETYTVALSDDYGADTPIENPQDVTWTIIYPHGVYFTGEDPATMTKKGASVSITVPYDADPGKAFTLSATYQGITGVVQPYVWPDRVLPAGLSNKIEYQWDFEDNLAPTKGGLTPTSSGTLVYADGVTGKGAVFKTGGNYLDFGNMDLAGKTITFSLKSNNFTGVQDPAILANKNWNDPKGKGFIFAYAYNTPDRMKSRIGDGTKFTDNTFSYSTELWQTIAIVFDNTGNTYKIYQNGNEKISLSTAGYASGWEKGAYSLKLGNDGTGAYKYNNDSNSDYEFVVDNFAVMSSALTEEEVKAVNRATVFVEKDIGKKEITSTLVGSETAPYGGLYNLDVHMKGDETKFIAKTTFDVNYDPDVMTYHGMQHQRSGLSVNTDTPGVLHVTFNGSLRNAPTIQYSLSRLFQPIFEMKALDADKDVTFEVTNFKGYNADNEPLTIIAHDSSLSMKVIGKDSMDYNGDGVIGAGDVALAPADRKEAVANASKIYPYKRALVITMDGAGNVWDPTAASYLAPGLSGTDPANYQKNPDKLDTVRNNPIAMKLFNEEFATSYTARSVNPPISAQNYCAITHGVPWKDLPAAYQHTNDTAAAKYWADFGRQTALYPSMFKLINDTYPEKKMAGIAEWSPITNGIIEPDSGVYRQYRASGTTNYLCFDQLEEYINADRFKDTSIVYMQSDTMDHYGHDNGYFTDGYYQELQKYDTYFPQIFDAMKAKDLYDDTLFIGNADHGGHLNSNGTSGSHGEDGWANDTTIFIGIGGQTVNSGHRLSGGSNEDIPALVFNGLRTEDVKGSFMPKSDVFDENAFLAQEDLYIKERTIENVTYDRAGNTASITVTNAQAGRTVTTLDAVIDLGGQTVSTVTPASGVTVLRKDARGGKLYLTLSGANLTSAAPATVTFSGAASATKMDEVMLGATGSSTNNGKEIYSDLTNSTDGEPVRNGSISIQGDSGIAASSEGTTIDYSVAIDLPGENTPEAAELAEVTWSISGNDGVTIPANSKGETVTVTIAPNAAGTFTLKATYGIMETQFRVDIGDAAIYSGLQQRTELKMDFEDNITPTVNKTGADVKFGGASPFTGAVTYAAGVDGKGAVFKDNSKFVDFGTYDLRNKTVAFSFKSNSFNAAKDPVILSNKDWDNPTPKGFVFAHAWEKATQWKTRVADGAKNLDKTGEYTRGSWEDFVLVFGWDGKSYDVYQNGALITTLDTSSFAKDWENGAYSLKLGNDGTGVYKNNSTANTKYEFVIDNLMIFDTPLNSKQVSVLKTGVPEDTFAVSGTSLSSGTLTVNYSKPAGTEALMVVAVFDGGKLVEYHTQALAGADSGALSKHFTLTNSGEVRVGIWDGLSTMRPLCPIYRN